jgi:hypothetical protein
MSDTKTVVKLPEHAEAAETVVAVDASLLAKLHANTDAAVTRVAVADAAVTRVAVAAPLSDELRDYYTMEYESVSDELIENESMGEGRVGLYLGVWSVGVAGVGALIASEPSTERARAEALDSVAVVGLGVLLVLGLITAARLVHRNHVTDVLVDAKCRLRRALQPAGADVTLLPWKPGEVKARRNTLGHTGLLHVVCLANAVVPAGIALVLRKLSPGILSLAGSAFAATLVVQLCAIFWLNHRAWRLRGGT